MDPSMFRFTIRDVLLVTLAAGFAVGWFREYKQARAANVSLTSVKQELRLYKGGHKRQLEIMALVKEQLSDLDLEIVWACEPEKASPMVVAKKAIGPVGVAESE